MVKNPQRLPREEQEKLATEFAEGSDEYRQLLLQLWECGIETKAGCSGILEFHKLKPEDRYCSFSYVAIVMSPKTEMLLHKFVAILRQNKFHERFLIETGQNVRSTNKWEKVTNPTFDDWFDLIEVDVTVVLRMASLGQQQTNREKKHTKASCEAFFKEIRNHFEAALTG